MNFNQKAFLTLLSLLISYGCNSNESFTTLKNELEYKQNSNVISITEQKNSQQISLKISYPKFSTKNENTREVVSSININSSLRVSIYSNKYNTNISKKFETNELQKGLLIRADEDDILSIQILHYAILDEKIDGEKEFLVFKGEVNSPVKPEIIIEMKKISEPPNLIENVTSKKINTQVSIELPVITRKLVTTYSGGSEPEIIIPSISPSSTPITSPTPSKASTSIIGAISN